jgi:uncharacterized protein (DUF2267 family)
MRHDEFVGQVQQRAGLASRAAAEGAILATLQTLGEQIPQRLTGCLADQLPAEIGQPLRRAAAPGGTGAGERFGRDEFVDRVARRTRMDRPRAVRAARVVFEVTDVATEPDLMRRLRAAVPEEVAELSRWEHPVSAG